MSEMVAALRQFADRLERNELGVKFAPAAAAIVLSGPQGETSASYIGRDLPAEAALTFLLARGIEKTVVSRLQIEVKP
jgi:hypothetical protein